MTIPGIYRPGQPGFIAPGSPEHRTLITPSKVAAILGLSRRESPYRLWHRMKGILEGEPDRDIFDVGHDFEPALAAMWRRRNPEWQLSPSEVQYVVDESDFGYPAAATLDRRARRGRARKVVEFKTARRLEDWGDLFTDEAPADYVAQITAQMFITGHTAHPAELVVMGPYFEAHTYVIPFDAEVAEVIHQRCREFYESLSGDEPPDLDDSVATYEAVRELHPDINPGEIAQIEHWDALNALGADADAKAADKALRAAKTVLLDAMGNAQSAYVGDVKIADRRRSGKSAVALYLNTNALDQLTAAREDQPA